MAALTKAEKEIIRKVHKKYPDFYMGMVTDEEFQDIVFMATGKPWHVPDIKKAKCETGTRG